MRLPLQTLDCGHVTMTPRTVRPVQFMVTDAADRHLCALREIEVYQPSSRTDLTFIKRSI